MENPSLFISYSHDNEQHEEWVLQLATDLRSHGVNAILDKWYLRLGADLRFFMEQGLSSSKLVLCICSENYVQKVNNGCGGAGYEGMIMTQPLLKDANKEFIIPVVRNNTSEQKVPLAFGSKNYIDFSNDSEYVVKYSELLARIYNEDIKGIPPLGKNPFSQDISKEIATRTEIESVLYHSPQMDGSVTFRFDNNNGIFKIGNGEYAFDTKWSRAGNNSIHAYGSIGYIPGSTEIPEMKNLSSYNYSSRCRTIRTGEIVIFENPYHHFAAIKLGQVKSSSHGYPYGEMQFDYHIYNVK